MSWVSYVSFLRCLLSSRSGLAELFGEGFAVSQGDRVQTVEDVEVEDETDDGEAEKDGNHEPRLAEIVRQDDDTVADPEACCEDAESDEDAELGGLLAADFGEVDLFRSGEGTKIADCPVDECREEKPADCGEGDH